MGLGAELIVVSVLSLVSVSLQDVLISAVTRELIGDPAVEGKASVSFITRCERPACTSIR